MEFKITFLFSFYSEEEPPKPEPEKEPEKCSLCRASPKEGSCVECGALCCRKCSKPIPSGKVRLNRCHYSLKPVNQSRIEIFQDEFQGI